MFPVLAGGYVSHNVFCSPHIEDNLRACLVLLVPVPDCSVRRNTTLVLPLSALV